MENDITAQKRFYRRGLVLGLTMAEIAILVIFSLLLAIGALLSSKDKEIEQLTSEVEEASSDAKELEVQIRELAATADITKNNFDDLFVDLTLKIQEAKDYQDNIAPLEERSDQLNEVDDVISKYNGPGGEQKSQERIEWLDAQLSIAQTARKVVSGNLDSAENPRNDRQRVQQELFALQQIRDDTALLEERSKQPSEIEDVLRQYDSPGVAERPGESTEWLDAQLSIAQTTREFTANGFLSNTDSQIERRREERELAALQKLRDTQSNQQNESGAERSWMSRLNPFKSSRSKQLSEVEGVIGKYGGPVNLEQSRERNEWLDAQLSIASTAQEVVTGRFDPTEDLEERRQRVEEGLLALQQLQDDIQMATAENRESAIKLDHTMRTNAELQEKNENLRGQLRHLQRGSGQGTEHPTCWATSTGKQEYIFDITLTDAGIVVADNALPNRVSAQKNLPLQQMIFDQELSHEVFLRTALPLYEWSKKEDCRFFVRVYDQTGPHEKSLYKNRLQAVESRFYKWEDRSGRHRD